MTVEFLANHIASVFRASRKFRGKPNGTGGVVLTQSREHLHDSRENLWRTKQLPHWEPFPLGALFSNLVGITIAPSLTESHHDQVHLFPVQS